MPRAKQEYNEDIFKDSTMTFGEHLEDLRRCLFKAVLGLVAGVAIGLCFGEWVVAVIERPLNQALEKYYKDSDESNIKREASEAAKEGKLLLVDPQRQLELVKEGYLNDEVYVDPKEFLVQLKHFYPDAFRDVKPLPSKPAAKAEPNAAAVPEAKAEVGEQTSAGDEDLMRIFLWHSAKNDPRLQPRSFGAHEPFMIWLKGGLLVGAILAGPWIFIQLWSFVAAGLYPHEKRYVNLYLPFSIGLFFVGVAVAYFFVFGPVLSFLFRFNRWLNITPELRITEWLGFVLFLPVGFGIAFQLPLVMLFLERIGVFTVKAYLSYWRVAILVIFVLAAIFTPPDPWSMSLLAFPLTLLYFGGILLCKWMPRGRGLLPAE
ncbi:MAG: twin-arginine translocase subunit TatC [Thermoguttaceae bacterium]